MPTFSRVLQQLFGIFNVSSQATIIAGIQVCELLHELLFLVISLTLQTTSTVLTNARKRWQRARRPD